LFLCILDARKNRLKERASGEERTRQERCKIVEEFPSGKDIACVRGEGKRK